MPRGGYNSLVAAMEHLKALMDKALPEFEQPPVIEVALSVQFDRIEGLRTPQLGVIWQTFRDRFPRFEEHPPLEPAFERFGLKSGAEAGVQLQLFATPPVPRLWFLNQSGNELIQVQQDRFVRNWRKKGDSEEYPRYRVLREQFAKDYVAFSESVSGCTSQTIQPNQCEITYVNIIPTPSGTPVGDLSKVTGLFSLDYSDEGLGLPEEESLACRYVLTSNQKPIGRLHVGFAPVLRLSDGAPAFRLTITVRGGPAGVELDHVLDFLDFGHEAIVRGFTSVTTQEMHQIWKRKS